jgi:hypothetical protein
MPRPRLGVSVSSNVKRIRTPTHQAHRHRTFAVGNFGVLKNRPSKQVLWVGIRPEETVPQGSEKFRR